MIFTASSSKWPCPAKLNLFLHFIGQRSDGYHLLQSYFQLLDIGDELEVTTKDCGTISFDCNQTQLQTSDNLVLRAANLLKESIDASNIDLTKLGAHLSLTKRLPIGGGVGGGSSDCATTLVALNHLWNLGLSTDKLAQLGESLGADVPFFVRGKSAFVEGIGEKITPFEIGDAFYLIIQPNSAVSTAQIFSDPLLTRNTKAITIRDLKSMRLPFEGINTMQPLVVGANQEVRAALTWLKSHVSNARMTGSGSSIFAVFDNQQDASKIADLCDSNWLSFVARGRKNSALYDSIGLSSD